MVSERLISKVTVFLQDLDEDLHDLILVRGTRLTACGILRDD